MFLPLKLHQLAVARKKNCPSGESYVPPVFFLFLAIYLGASKNLWKHDLQGGPSTGYNWVYNSYN